MVKLEEKKINELILNENFITIKRFENIKKYFSTFKVVSKDYSKIRGIKTKEELSLIQKAVDITDNLFSLIVKHIKVGMTEIQLESILLKLIIDSNADGPSFEPIVAFGKNSSIPHWKPSNTKFSKDDIIKLDFGVFYKGYASDLTRTFTLSEFQNSEMIERFKILKEAQSIAIKNIKPGVEFKYLDGLVRNHLKKFNLDKYFTHSLGHGIGVEIHEYPSIGPSSINKFEKGMVVTVEPGIYFPNEYGMRLENDVYVDDNKAIVLNNSPIKLSMLKNGKE